MKKKSFLVLVFVTLVTNGIRAQSKNSVSIDAAPLFKGIIASDSDAKTSFVSIGAFFEHTIGNYSIGARGDVSIAKFNSADGFYFGVEARGRYYPLTPSEKLFFDAGFGFNTASLESSELFSGLTFGIKAGWKQLVAGLIFIEPAIGYHYSKSSEYFPTAPLGWQLGLSAGMSF